MKKARITRVLESNPAKNEPTLAYVVATPSLINGFDYDAKVYVSGSGDYPGEQFISVLVPKATRFDAAHDLSVDALGAYVRAKRYLEDSGYEVVTEVTDEANS